MTAQNRRQGSILSGLLLMALGIIALMVGTGIFVAHNVRVVTAHRGNGSDFSLDVPGGHFNMRARHGNMTLASLGIPAYPGAAQSNEGGGASFEWTSDDSGKTDGIAVSGSELVTSDSGEKVLAFYRARLPGWFIVTDRDGVSRFEFDKDGYKRIVAIREKRDGTHIAVATVGEPASN